MWRETKRKLYGKHKAEGSLSVLSVMSDMRETEAMLQCRGISEACCTKPYFIENSEIGGNSNSPLPLYKKLRYFIWTVSRTFPLSATGNIWKIGFVELEIHYFFIRDTLHNIFRQF